MSPLKPPADGLPPDLIDRLVARAASEGLLDVAYARVDSPLGPLLAARTPRGLATLSYADFRGGVDAVVEDLATRLSPRILEAPGRLDDVRRQLDEYFAGRRDRFDMPLDLVLVAGFRRRVLEATAGIPFGETRSYAEVATAAGNAKAVRAAGTALGHNPIPIVVPCHRVLRSGGALGNYTGGVEKKEALLRIEGVIL